MSADFWMGVIAALICILVGAIIAFVLIAVLGDRGAPGPGPDDEPPIDPTPDELQAWREVWLKDHTVTKPFEANLLERR